MTRPLTSEELEYVDGLRALDKITLAVKIMRAEHALRSIEGTEQRAGADIPRMQALHISPQSTAHQNAAGQVREAGAGSRPDDDAPPAPAASTAGASETPETDTFASRLYADKDMDEDDALEFARSLERRLHEYEARRIEKS